VISTVPEFFITERQHFGEQLGIFNYILYFYLLKLCMSAAWKFLITRFAFMLQSIVAIQNKVITVSYSSKIYWRSYQNILSSFFQNKQISTVSNTEITSTNPIDSFEEQWQELRRKILKQYEKKARRFLKTRK